MMDLFEAYARGFYTGLALLGGVVAVFLLIDFIATVLKGKP